MRGEKLHVLDVEILFDRTPLSWILSKYRWSLPGVEYRYADLGIKGLFI